MAKKELLNYIRKLKKISRDETNNIIVCNCDDYFIDFDKLKTKKRTKKEPQTPDLLIISVDKKEVWFIEFKSSTFKSLNKDKYKLERKALEGLIVFYELYRDYFDYKKIFFVVYNKHLSHEEDLMFKLYERSIEFGLENLIGKFFEDVLTEDCEWFKKLMEKRFSIKLTCSEE